MRFTETSFSFSRIASRSLLFARFYLSLFSSVSGPHATLMAYCAEFYGAEGRAKIPLLVGLSVQFGCVINAGETRLSSTMSHWDYSSSLKSQISLQNRSFKPDRCPSLALAWLVVPQSWSFTIWDGAFVYNSWRIFLSLCGVPTLIGVVCLCFFPESPKFLMTQGRNEDALEIFRKIFRVNTGLPKDNYPVSERCDR